MLYHLCLVKVSVSVNGTYFLFLYAKVFYNPYEPKLRLDECTSCTAIGKADVSGSRCGSGGKGKAGDASSKIWEGVALLDSRLALLLPRP